MRPTNNQAYVGAVGRAGDDGGRIDLDLRQLPRQQFGRGGLPDPEHEQVVEVTDHLTGLRAVADAGLDVRERLRVRRDLQAGTAALVD